ncbi:putative leucine-rich repeat receptor-like serine/threonine-protein kinase At2g24130 [Morus notabilis]|uniref:putative leucine-rich repeat receptor-like serine/threonine-protein kinase At2g24130 n=1 Tax=Morus notabilis TaxID=981085 RepID=UPI000CED1D41|nr:putative leucine-rich repeat receptor-like serine/threonine-protein kinase At2g24130 [Morus notabilis]
MVYVNTMFLFLVLQHAVVTWVWGRAARDHGPYHHHPRHSLVVDKAALLRFKKGITEDPFSVLSNWNDSVHVCHFNGVKCDRNHHRVSQLVLNESQLVGVLSPFLSNLTGLRILWIVNSHLFGTIPREFSSLTHLKSLLLEGNNLFGPIPDSLSLLPNLKTVILLDNNLNGTFSPAFFSNCSSSFQNLDVSANSFSGEIPTEIGNCVNLWSLNLYNNRFSGVLPLSLINISSLLNLDVEYNHFSGELPTEIIGSFPSLIFLHLSFNKMKSHNGNTDLSPFFDAVRNCTGLEELEMAGMGFGGTLPASIGQFLGANLTVMLLQDNKIFGSIPPSISNFSKLRMLNLSSNLMTGTISDEMRVLPRLEQLFLSHNCFSGPIPKVLGKFPSLGLLDLSHNKFFGEIPESLGNLSRLSNMFLNNNQLSGKIPSTLGRCTELLTIDLSYNRLAGKIPSEISGMSGIRIFINFSNNQLEGPLPLELSKLEDVQEMDFSSNNLSGSIFPQISSCISVRLINFSNNSLEGKLPDSLVDLKDLESFDVSRNHLSGIISSKLNNSVTLTYLNLSFNDFVGTIPSGGIFNSVTQLSFLGNSRLCGIVGGTPLPCCKRPLCTHKRHLFHSRVFLIVFLIMTILLALFLATCCAFCFGCIVVVPSKKAQVVTEPTSPEFIHNIPRITYRELADATEGFHDKTLIGSGSYGHVYKGVLSNGTTIAVKVLHTQSSSSIDSFRRECEALKIIRHRNVIRIITVCSFPDFKALVFPYMANGSLDSRLYELPSNRLSSRSSCLTLAQRVNICSDVAEGMAYLHHQAPIVVIHCDLKPSNVLLNSDMTALVSDFGISTLLTPKGAAENLENSTSDNILVGSVGYIPPDDMFVGGLTLQHWVSKSYRHENIEKVVDAGMARASRDLSSKRKKIWEVSIGSLIELGLRCTQDSPSSRPTMLDVAVDLNRLKRDLCRVTKII